VQILQVATRGLDIGEATGVHVICPLGREA
jgi:hypothetical protein